MHPSETRTLAAEPTTPPPMGHKSDGPSARSSRVLTLVKLLPVLIPIAVIIVGWLLGADVSREGAYAVVDFAKAPPCSGRQAQDCLKPAPAVLASYTDQQACKSQGKLVCIVPMGSISHETISKTVANIEKRLRLDVRVLPPLDIPESALNSERGQFSASEIIQMMRSRYPVIEANSGTLLVALTPVDIYMTSIPRWRFAFGQRTTHIIGLNYAVISSHRMNTQEYVVLGGRIPVVVIYGYDAASRQDRTEKLLTKYVGISYFGLVPSDDPKSVLFNNILRVSDLDRMGRDLPIEGH